jgi:hypothetical protein
MAKLTPPHIATIDVHRFLDASDIRSLGRLADLCAHERAKAAKRSGWMNAIGGVMLGTIASFLRDSIIPALLKPDDTD